MDAISFVVNQDQSAPDTEVLCVCSSGLTHTRTIRTCKTVGVTLLKVPPSKYTTKGREGRDRLSATNIKRAKTTTRPCHTRIVNCLRHNAHCSGQAEMKKWGHALAPVLYGDLIRIFLFAS